MYVLRDVVPFRISGHMHSGVVIHIHAHENEESKKEQLFGLQSTMSIWCGNATSPIVIVWELGAASHRHHCLTFWMSLWPSYCSYGLTPSLRITAFKSSDQLFTKLEEILKTAGLEVVLARTRHYYKEIIEIEKESQGIIQKRIEEYLSSPELTKEETEFLKTLWEEAINEAVKSAKDWAAKRTIGEREPKKWRTDQGPKTEEWPPPMDLH